MRLPDDDYTRGYIYRTERQTLIRCVGNYVDFTH